VEPTEPYPTRINTTSHPMDVDDDEPVDPEGDAAYWRAKAEEAKGALDGALEAIEHWRAKAEGGGVQVDGPYEPLPDGGVPVQSVYVPAEYPRVADHLAEASEAFVRDMRAAWTRLPNRSRPYEAHAALLEALATYHKARNRS